MKTYLTTALFLMFNLCMISCGTSQNKSDSRKATTEEIMNTLNNTSWVLQRIDEQNRDFNPTEDQKELILSFQDNRYSTSDGCNGQGGEFEVKDNQINFIKGMSTLRYCGEEMVHLIYKIPFDKIKSVQIIKDKLQFLDENSNIIATYIKK